MSSDDPYVGFEVSPRAREIYGRLRDFMEAHVYPNEGKFHEQLEAGERWQPVALMEELKARARAEGLWNLFMPPSHGATPVDDSFQFDGPALSNLQYAFCAEEMGRIIMEGGNAMDIAAQAEKEGVKDLRKSALKEVRDGKIDLAQANACTVED